MLDSFVSYINKERLFEKKDVLLTGVSGGIDSIVMLDLLLKAGYRCAVAHCNFQLRDREADGDELFVKTQAEYYGLPFHSTRFDTEDHARKNSISIQMAARELRYQWFEEIRKKHNYSYVAMAHQKDDIIETFIMNLSRGTGIRGLTGIKSRNGLIVRPLLFASKNEIEKYGKENNLLFREDSSNASLKYKRNKIRHSIIPLLEEINPDIRLTCIENIERFRDIETIFTAAIEEKKIEMVTEDNNGVRISIDPLKKLPAMLTYLYEFMRPFGFSQEVVRNIASSLDAVPGRQFFSNEYKAVKDRQYIYISKIQEPDDQFYYIDENSPSVEKPVPLTIQTIRNVPGFKIPDAADTACLDFDLLEFPLILRKWKTGDAFMPLGMNQMKKVSDFLIDEKIPLHEKQNLWILLSGNKIAWIIGKRIDDRFKITGKTKTIRMFSAKREAK